jgi:hypothetical protein
MSMNDNREAALNVVRTLCSFTVNGLKVNTSLIGIDTLIKITYDCNINLDRLVDSTRAAVREQATVSLVSQIVGHTQAVQDLVEDFKLAQVAESRGGGKAVIAPDLRERINHLTSELSALSNALAFQIDKGLIVVHDDLRPVLLDALSVSLVANRIGEFPEDGSTMSRLKRLLLQTYIIEDARLRYDPQAEELLGFVTDDETDADDIEAHLEKIGNLYVLLKIYSDAEIYDDDHYRDVWPLFEDRIVALMRHDPGALLGLALRDHMVLQRYIGGSRESPRGAPRGGKAKTARKALPGGQGHRLPK